MKSKTLLKLFILILTLLMALSLCSCGDDTPDTAPDGSNADLSSTPKSEPAKDSTPAGDSSIDSGSNPGGDSKPDPEPEQDPEIDPNWDIQRLNIDYKTMTYVGTSLKDFSPIFDEQDMKKDPYVNIKDVLFPTSIVKFYDADGNGDITEADYNHEYEVTVDLGARHYIECVYVFFEKPGDTIILETGTPFKYNNTVEFTAEQMSWARIDIGKFTRYINVRFKNGQAVSELFAYGIRTGEYDPINTEKHEYKTFDYFLGINGNQADKKQTIACASYFRDYVNWRWCYETSVYPDLPGTTFASMMATPYDSNYRSYSHNYDVRPVPCYMFAAADFGVIDPKEYTNPNSYVMYGEFLYQVAVRYGNNPLNTTDNIKILAGNRRLNANTIQWIEAGNEPNGEGNDGFSPYELAALTSTSYDGHEGTVISQSGSLVGVKVADPNMKMAMAGLAGVGTRYIQAMSFWMQYNRTDGQLALDAFNVHTYCKKLIKFNGYQVYVGVCPEIGKITEYVEELCDWRDKYHPDKEVWLTEFGWDTNTSYDTENACHPYGDYTAREIQAMWLVRAYFMFASIGVDRAAMYMASDVGDEATSTGKYGTSGVISKSGERKDSFYYILTLKNLMGDMRFAEIIDSGNKDVWIYRFENDEGKSCYALWCPTMDNIKVDGYKLNIDGSTATLAEFANKQESGISSSLEVTNGTVTVNVSERPILVFSE